MPTFSYDVQIAPATVNVLDAAAGWGTFRVPLVGLYAGDSVAQMRLALIPPAAATVELTITPQLRAAGQILSSADGTSATGAFTLDPATIAAIAASAGGTYTYSVRVWVTRAGVMQDREVQAGTLHARAALVSTAVSPVASVTVTPAAPTPLPGTTVQLTATPRDGNGVAVGGQIIAWASSNTNVVTVDANGLVTCIVVGSAVITATTAGVSGTATVTVSAPSFVAPALGDVVTYRAAGWVPEHPFMLTGSGYLANGSDFAGFAKTAHTHAFSSLTGKPTTIAGYGITDALPNTGAGAGSIYFGQAGGTFALRTLVAGANIAIVEAGGNVTVSASAAPQDFAFSSLTGKPTTIAGYGITDAYTAAQSDARFAPIAHTHSAADVVSGTLAPARGGTGLSSPVAGGLLIAAAAAAMTLLAPGAGGQVVRSTGAAWASSALASTDLSDLATLAAFSATKLATARTINGVAFDGTVAITVPAAAGTLTGTVLNAGVVTSSLTTTGTLVSLGVTGAVTAGSFAGPLTGAVTGNASTATALQTGRTINGVLFDGTGNITISAAAAANLLTGTTLAANVVASSLTSAGVLAALHMTAAVVDSGGLTVNGQFTNAAGTLVASAPKTVTQTWNNAGVAFTAQLSNVTDSASAAASLLADWQVGGVSKFSVSKIGVMTNSATNVGTTSQDGTILQNTTAAAAGLQQWSPRTRWSGRGWATTPVASQSVDFIAELQTQQGAANPAGNLIFLSSVNGGAYTTLFGIGSGGNIGIQEPPQAGAMFAVGGTMLNGAGYAQCLLFDNVMIPSTVSYAYGLSVVMRTQAAAFTVNTVYCIAISDTAKGAGSLVGTQYGVYVGNLTAGSANFAVYTAGTTQSYFGGALTVASGGVTISAGGLAVTGLATFANKATYAASVAGAAGLTVPHGIAPTTLVDGDLWTTTAGLFVRINGVTKTVTLT